MNYYQILKTEFFQNWKQILEHLKNHLRALQATQTSNYPAKIAQKKALKEKEKRGRKAVFS